MSERHSQNWMQTSTGKAFWPTDPHEYEVDIEDIAHALAHQCRYGGHAKCHYSVAEHCYLLSTVVPPEHALAALMHDAAETYLQDIVRPVKKYLAGYADIERGLEKVIFTKYGIPYPLPQVVMDYDIAICRDEKDAVMAEAPMPWAENEPLGVEIQCWPPNIAKQMFLMRFRELYHE